jgi:ABC-2 type transport system permease protein
MRWLLVKDTQILRRSPLLVGILVIYPIAIALMIGFALSSPPGKPKVAVYDGISGKGQIRFGSQRIDVSSYAHLLYDSIDPVFVHTRAEAIEKVRDGRALAALIVPSDIPNQIQDLINEGVGSPTVELILNSQNPIERQYVNQAIGSKVTQVEQAISKKVLNVAVTDLNRVLAGGAISLAGIHVQLLGLKNSETIVNGAIQTLGPHSALAPALRQVAEFASQAIEGLGFASPVLGSIGSPLTVQTSELSGSTTPTASFAVAIAAVVSLMFVTLLLAAGMLALERAENAYARLIRGLVGPGDVLAEKIALAAAAAAVVTIVMSAVVSIFVGIEWSRFELWLLAIVFLALAFAAVGAAIGAFARDVSAASLMAFLVSLPIAFIALVPATAVSGLLHTVLAVISFVFPFRAGLDAVNDAFSGGGPALELPLLHLVGLTLAFWVLGRLALRRFTA